MLFAKSKSNDLTERVNAMPLQEIFAKLFTNPPDHIDSALRQGAHAGPHYRNYLEETRLFLIERIAQPAHPEKREMYLRLWREYELQAHGRIVEQYPPQGPITEEPKPAQPPTREAAARKAKEVAERFKRLWSPRMFPDPEGRQ